MINDNVTKAAASLLKQGTPTPYYVIDVEGIRAAAIGFRSVWRETFPRAAFAYSYKTNPFSAVTSTLVGLGYEGEVTTESEWNWALEDGLAPPSLIVNGPAKSDLLLKKALAGRALVQIDGTDELARILGAVGESPTVPQLGLRLSHLLADGRFSRFGFTSVEAENAVERLRAAGLKLASIHVHTPTHLSPTGRLAALCAYQDFLRDLVRTEPSIAINIGGGDPPFRDDYNSREKVRAHARMLAEFFIALGFTPEQLEVRLEPGRALTEANGFLFSRVVGRKPRPDGLTVLTDARSECLRSRNRVKQRPTAAFSKRKSQFDLPSSAPSFETIHVYGTHCYEDDLLAKARLPSDIAIGDVVVFGAAGAYDVTTCGTWSGPRPSIFAVDGPKRVPISPRKHKPPSPPKAGVKRPMDRVFELEPGVVQPFVFDDSVAQVFDDMVGRSVPLYQEIQDLIARLAIRWAGNAPIIDVGCSTGSSLAKIISLAETTYKLVGIDPSEAMIEQARRKLQPLRNGHSVHLEACAIQDFDFAAHDSPGVVILSLVAQFIRPIERRLIVRRIYEAIKPAGALIVVEKTIDPNPLVSNVYIEEYHKRKRHWGYSDNEVRNKREALENRLIPFQPDENIDLLLNGGFQTVSVFFTWLNFQGYLALKSA